MWLVNLSKTIALALVLVLAATSLMMMGSSVEQSIPKPSVPEFTIKYVEHPYDVPSTYGTDLYTGKTIITNQGYHVENKSIEVIIKNQNFVSYKDLNGNSISLMYNIRWKGHFDNTDTWSYFAGTANSQEYTLDYFRASNAEYSTWIATLSLGEWERNAINYNFIITVPTEGQIDFQVEALVGYSSLKTGQSIPLGATSLYEFTGTTSGWSGTRTISLPDGSVFVSTPDSTASSSVTPTSTATVSEKSTSPTAQSNADSSAFLGLEWVEIVIVMLLAAVVVLLGLVVVYLRKRSLK